MSSSERELLVFWKRAVRSAWLLMVTGAVILYLAAPNGPALALGLALGGAISVLRFQGRLRALVNLRTAAPLVRGRLMGYALNAAVLGVAFSYPESISPWSTAAGLLVMNVSIVATEVLSQVGRSAQSEAAAQQRSG